MAMPNLRFKADDGSDFPTWGKVRLGDIGCFISGLTFSASDSVETDGIAVLTSTNINSDGTLDYRNNVKQVSKDANQDQYLCPNDIVICKSNGNENLVGKAAKYDGGYSGSRGITVGAFCGIFRSSVPIIPWWFQTDDYKRLIKQSQQGGKGSLSNIKGSDIENHYTLLPTSIDEQHKITNCLGAIDDVIAKAKAEIEVWELRKKGVVQRLFSQEVRFKADDGSDFPTWGKVRLGDIGCFISGLTFSASDSVETDGIAVLTSTNINSDGTLDYRNNVKQVSKDANQDQYLCPNDIVICKSNGNENLVGKAAKYDGGYSGSRGITVGAFCGIFRSSVPIIPWWFQTDDYKRLIKQSQQGGKGSLSNIKGSDIENHYTLLPTSIDEQHKIANCLGAIDDVIAKTKAELELWRELKRGLLQQLFV